ncbi:MAG: OmpA family protein [Cytophagaceae bacterium]|nr:OmpA family protein [Cytophagaceae bacterium]
MKTNPIITQVKRMVLYALTLSVLTGTIANGQQAKKQTTKTTKTTKKKTATKKKGLTRQQKGALIGAGAGAVAGAIIGKKSGRAGVGAIIGAAVGGTAGALIALYMDKQAEELRDKLRDAGATIERIGEDEVRITFKSGVLFAYNSTELTGASQQNIGEMDAVLKKYGQTDIYVSGHTDNTGSDAYNQGLSERRARSVTGYMAQNGVETARLKESGYGESQPIATNQTPAGRDRNRRVEVSVKANNKVRRAAERGDLDELKVLTGVELQ